MTEVEGWYPEPELKLLRAAAEAAPPGAFVEVGVYKGRSAQVLASYDRELWLYDDLSLEGADTEHWPPNALWWEGLNLLEVDPPRSIALLHHDAAHDYATVLRHLTHFHPEIVPGGFVVLHDWKDYPGVATAWADFSGRQEYEVYGEPGNVMVYRKAANVKNSEDPVQA
jgi:hypothetical protein